MEPSTDLHIRPARAGDDAFILGLVPRLFAFELPPWRNRDECADGVHRDLEHRLRDRSEPSEFFIAETADESPAGFLHLQRTIDFFTGALNCHISDLIVANGMDGRGIGARLLAFTDAWAREHGCRYVTLSAFPGNARARALYERHGYGIELLRMAKPLS